MGKEVDKYYFYLFAVATIILDFSKSISLIELTKSTLVWKIITAISDNMSALTSGNRNVGSTWSPCRSLFLL